MLLLLPLPLPVSLNLTQPTSVILQRKNGLFSLVSSLSCFKMLMIQMWTKNQQQCFVDTSAQLQSPFWGISMACCIPNLQLANNKNQRVLWVSHTLCGHSNRGHC